MSALTDLSDILNRLSGGNSGTPEHLWFWIDNREGSAAATAAVSGRMQSTWLHNKFPGGQGAAPTGTAVNPDNTTAGGLLQADPGGGRQKWLLGMEAAGNVAGALMLFDRLAHFGGLSGTTTTAQNTTSLAVSRYTGADSVGNMIAVEINTQIGATGTTIAASYTNQAGTSGRTTKAVVIGGTGFREKTRLIFLPLQDGDTGVRSVESVTVLATTGAAGDFAVLILRPLTSCEVQGQSVIGIRDLISSLPALVEIKTDACLFLVFSAGAAAAPQIIGALHSVEA